MSIRKNINDLVQASSVSASDLIEILQGDQNKQATLTQILALISASVYSRSQDISSAQILDLHNTPVIAIPAPGVGYYNKVVSVDHILDHGGVSYVAVSSPQVSLYYGANDSYRIHSTYTTLLTQAADTVSSFTGSFNLFPLSAIENQAIYLKITAGTGSFTTGNGTLKIRAVYQTVSING